MLANITIVHKWTDGMPTQRARYKHACKQTQKSKFPLVPRVDRSVKNQLTLFSNIRANLFFSLRSPSWRCLLSSTSSCKAAAKRTKVGIFKVTNLYILQQLKHKNITINEKHNCFICTNEKEEIAKGLESERDLNSNEG